MGLIGGNLFFGKCVFVGLESCTHRRKLSLLVVRAKVKHVQQFRVCDFLHKE